MIVPWHRGGNGNGGGGANGGGGSGGDSGGGGNDVAIDLIAGHIRSKLARHDLLRIYPNLGAVA